MKKNIKMIIEYSLFTVFVACLVLANFYGFLTFFTKGNIEGYDSQTEQKTYLSALLIAVGAADIVLATAFYYYLKQKKEQGRKRQNQKEKKSR